MMEKVTIEEKYGKKRNKHFGMSVFHILSDIILDTGKANVDMSKTEIIENDAIVGKNLGTEHKQGLLPCEY